MRATKITNEEIDEKYEDLKKAERKVKREKKKNNYRLTVRPCCLTCKHSSRMSCEDGLECSELAQDRWLVNSVEALGICDKYVMRDLGERR